MEMRRRLKALGVRQQIAVVGRIIVLEGRTAPRFVGPHAVEARELALAVRSSICGN